MKACPWCQSPFDFVTFMTHCGSDTLVRHPSSAHSREHICGQCHKKFWIFYHPRRFALHLRRYVFWGLAGGLILGIAFLHLFMGWEVGQALMIGLIFFFFFIPAAVSYARYQSVDLNQEK